MKACALLCLLSALAAAGGPPETLFDDLVEVAPGQARTLAIPARQAPARVAASFRVLRGAEARLILLPAESIDAWIEGKAYEELSATRYGRSGALSCPARAPRELVLVVQVRNGGKRLTRLRLLVRALDPAAPFPPVPQPADRTRGALLVWSSLALFTIVAAASAVRLHRLFSTRR